MIIKHFVITNGIWVRYEVFLFVSIMKNWYFLPNIQYTMYKTLSAHNWMWDFQWCCKNLCTNFKKKCLTHLDENNKDFKIWIDWKRWIWNSESIAIYMWNVPFGKSTISWNIYMVHDQKLENVGFNLKLKMCYWLSGNRVPLWRNRLQL